MNKLHGKGVKIYQYFHTTLVGDIYTFILLSVNTDCSPEQKQCLPQLPETLEKQCSWHLYIYPFTSLHIV